MTLIKYNPINTLTPFRNFLNDPFFKPFFNDRETGSWEPVVDIYGEGEKIILTADLPGVKKEDISIDVENRVLTLKGERDEDKEIKEGNYYKRERVHGSFQRSFSLPEEIKTEDIEAGFQDGVLKIQIPRPEKSVTRKQITIN